MAGHARFLISIVSIVLLAVVVSTLQAQVYHRCSSMEYLEFLKTTDPYLEENRKAIEEFTQDYITHSPVGSRAVVTIPVVFHVLYNTAAQNISDALLLAQLNQLNADFARLNTDAGNTPAAFASLGTNTNIQFCLATRDPSGNPTTGILRRSTAVTSFSTNNAVKSNATGGSNAWPAGSYLNIWVCNLGSSLLGYAQFPGGAAATDGVVVLYSSVGSISTPGTAVPYHLGRTATHEVGHWLNLYHIWGDDGTACTGSDNVNDTPNQAGPNSGCPTFPKLSCSNGPNGDMYMNYMDYTTDPCMNIFTEGQSARMNALFAPGGARASLLNSLGCVVSLPPSCPTPTGLATLSVNTNLAYANWSSVSVAISYNLQYKLLSSPTWTTTLNTKDTILPMSGLFSGTAYQWRVQTVCANDTSVYSTPVSFTTLGSCVDNYEPNNSSAIAPVLALNTDLSAQISSASDEDWYTVTTSAPNTKLRVDLTNLPANYNMVLYNSSTNLKIVASENAGTRAELIKHNATTAGTYYLKIYGVAGAFNATKCYNLMVSTSSNNFRVAEDTEVPEGGPEMVLRAIPNPAQYSIKVQINSIEASVGMVSLCNSGGQIVAGKQVNLLDGANSFDLELSNLPSGLYYLFFTNNQDVYSTKVVIAR